MSQRVKDCMYMYKESSVSILNEFSNKHLSAKTSLSAHFTT